MKNNSTIISVNHLYKKFCRNLRSNVLYGTSDIAKSFFNLPLHGETLRKDEFWALHDISFEIKKGESLGIVGPNGSGKTTLLRMLSGIFPPDKGLVSVKGRVGSLISLGAGFHPHMTGRENVYLNGAILGIKKKLIDKKLDSILEFADIGNFIDAPVSTYSSGMIVRLGFAIAIQADIDILLTDEILAVGDISFQKKCSQYLENKILNKEITLILVSHSIYNITRLCSKTLLLKNGRLISFNSTDKVVPEYYKCMEIDPRLHSVKNKLTRNGAGEIRVSNVSVINNKGQKCSFISIGEDICFIIELVAIRSFNIMPNIYTKIKDGSNTTLVYSMLPENSRRKYNLKRGKNYVYCTFRAINLIPGKYYYEVKIGGGGDIMQDLASEAATFTIEASNVIYNSSSQSGLVHLNNTWSNIKPL